MALVYPGVRCAICKAEVDLGTDFFATSGVFFPPEHRLYPFCDAAIHWECYEPWPDREEFARQYFQMWLEGNETNPYWGIALRTETFFVSLNPDPEVDAIKIHLAESGYSVRVSLTKWQAWLEDPDTALAGLRPLVRHELMAAWPLLRREVPDRDTLIGRVDWHAKRKVLEQQREQSVLAERERLRKPRLHNKACRAVLRERPVCPYCNNEGEIRYVDKAPQEKSYFICQQCGRSFGPAEVAAYRVARLPIESDG
ncbi:MAG: hypothetical protein ACK47B_22710 [Armatimonadota bacterium]